MTDIPALVERLRDPYLWMHNHDCCLFTEAADALEEAARVCEQTYPEIFGAFVAHIPLYGDVGKACAKEILTKREL